MTGTRDRDGTATAAENEDLPVPQDCQARAEGIAQRERGPTIIQRIARLERILDRLIKATTPGNKAVQELGIAPEVREMGRIVEGSNE